MSTLSEILKRVQVSGVIICPVTLGELLTNSTTLEKSIVSNPTSGMKKVTNIYYDPVAAEYIFVTET